MTKVRRSYDEFKSIVQSRGLQLISGDTRSDAYHIIAIDGQITYETFITKDGGLNQIDFETNYLSQISARLTSDPDWDDIQTTKPSSTTTLHRYFNNAVEVMSVLVTYETPARNDVLRVQKTRL
jgi:hypothetical protein